MGDLTFPDIGTVDDVARLLKYSKKTVYKWTSAHAFPRGVVIGRGRYNLTRLRESIEKGETFLTRKAA